MPLLNYLDWKKDMRTKLGLLNPLHCRGIESSIFPVRPAGLIFMWHDSKRQEFEDRVCYGM